MNQETPPTRPDRDVPWRLVGLVGIVALLAVFVVQNWETSPVEFLFFDINSRLSISLIVAVILGALLDRLYTGVRRIRRRDD